MMIQGCDLHTRYQQIAMLDTDTGELVERRLEHENGEARAFYAALSGPVRVRIEATGHTHWFEAMLAELGHELWMGDAAKIRASVVRKQKTDARQHHVPVHLPDQHHGSLRPFAVNNFFLRYLLGQTSTDDRGHYHFPHLAWGWYSLVVMAEPWWSSLARGQGYTTNPYKQDAAFNLIYSTVFYPGVTDPASASQIALTEGQDFTADFTLAPTASPTLRLLHFNKDPGLMRRAILKQKLFGAEIEIPMQRQIAVDDSVEISGVPPTQYILEVDSFRPGSVSRAVTLDLTSDTEFDMDGTPSLSPIKGTILVAAEHSLPVQASIRLWNSRTGELLESAIGPKGEFSLDAHSVTPGSYSVFVGNIENSLIEKITAVGARVVGQTVEIRGAKPVQLNITLSHGWSTINGTAMHDGKPMAGAMILLVPDDPEINLPLFRRDQSDSDGTFTLRNVLPGRYRVLALDNAWDAEWANPALLKGRLDHVQSVDVQPNRIYNSVINVE
jgi:hypothetical protein